ncbi:MAG: hypothetical protein LGR52_13915 [Candidatus Thiosymbion ectosymbiont of Robbea hypermnestra]|nr:hypothetical protein [Candidatus Thiosymbion ectosymbiont of Robbea hypermnestra]
MTKKCVYHSGRDATREIDGKNYCAKCEQGQATAAKIVDKHVDPRDCFIWYLGGDKWAAITGTGCAHWVAHQTGIKKGVPTYRCLKGFTVKIADIANGKKQVKSLNDVKVGDIYVNPAKTHCGIVSKTQMLPGKPGTPSTKKIEIQHDSSRQGRVAKNDFATYFSGKGAFFR